jgi:hypothetical protein
VVIYAEYLFLENAATGWIILLLTGKVAGIRCNKWLLFTGSVLCGIYSFVLFLDTLSPVLSLLTKLGFSAVVVFLVFRPRGPGNLRKSHWFFIWSVLQWAVLPSV